MNPSRDHLLAAVRKHLPVADYGVWQMHPMRFADLCVALEQHYPHIYRSATPPEWREIVDEVRTERYQSLPVVRVLGDVLPRLVECDDWRSQDMLPQLQDALDRVRQAIKEPQRWQADKYALRDIATWIEWGIRYIAWGDDVPQTARVRVIPVDPFLLRKWMEAVEEVPIVHDTDAPRRELLPYLELLSARELEAYTLVRGDGFSFGDAAQLMRVSKARVQICLRRAQYKINEAKQNHQ